MLQNYSSGLIGWRPELAVPLPVPAAVREQGPGRAALMPAITRELFSGHTCGVLLMGGPGVGKSFITKQVIEMVNGSAVIVKLRGSSALTSIDYGVLGPLLTQLDPDVADSPQRVITGLVRLFHSRSAGRPVVLVVENADRVDEKSAMVLVQLASSRYASLLAVCTDDGSRPAAWEGLWGEGNLSRIDVDPLTLSETERLLEGEYGRFSRTAVRQAWNLSRGIPRNLLGLIDQQISNRALAQRDGIWVVTGVVPSAPALGGDYLMARIESLTRDRREVLELLALSGTLQLSVLSHVCSPDDLDWLQEHGFFQIYSRPYPVVEFRDAVLATAVRASVPAARSRQLRDRFLDRLPAELPSVATPSFAEWTLNCGETLHPDLALQAAHAANTAGNPEQARRFVAAVPGHRLRAGFLAEELKALMSLGQCAQARQVLESQLNHPGWRPSFSEWAELMLLSSSLPTDRATTADDTIITLRRVWKRLADETDTVSPTRSRALRSQLLVAEGTLLADRGRYAEVEQLLTHSYEHADANDIDFRLQAGSLLCEAWAARGQHDDASRFASDLELRLQQPGVHRQTVEYVRTRLLIVYLVTSQPDKCMAIVSARTAPGDGAGIHSAEERGIVEGLLHLHHGQFDRALAAFLPAISQLREGNPTGALGLALAGCAYCYAVKDEPEEANRYLRQASTPTCEQPWFCEQITDYLKLITAALLGLSDRPAQTMIARAEEYGRNSQRSMELIFLAGATQLGSERAPVMLARTATQMQGEFADLYGDYGVGVIDRDSKLLLDAARDALTVSNHALAQGCASAALQVAEDTCDPAPAREARSIIQSMTNKTRKQQPALAASSLALLTRREREIALAAVPGVTNIDLSRKLHISVRTVEGHLYQIYSKLHLTCREELQTLASTSSTSDA